VSLSYSLGIRRGSHRYRLSIRVAPYSKAIFRSPFHTLIQSQPWFTYSITHL